jgi:adenylate cyclase
LAIAAWVEAHTANPLKTVELCRRAERLSPRDPRAWMIATSLGIAHFIEGRFDQAAAYFQKAVVDNPRFTIALRDLAANLAMLGEQEKAEAEAVIQELLKIEPQLTLSKLRARTRFSDDPLWKDFPEGLRRAGLPE